MRSACARSAARGSRRFRSSWKIVQEEAARAGAQDCWYVCVYIYIYIILSLSLSLYIHLYIYIYIYSSGSRRSRPSWRIVQEEAARAGARDCWYVCIHITITITIIIIIYIYIYIYSSGSGESSKRRQPVHACHQGTTASGRQYCRFAATWEPE